MGLTNSPSLTQTIPRFEASAPAGLLLGWWWIDRMGAWSRPILQRATGVDPHWPIPRGIGATSSGGGVQRNAALGTVSTSRAG